jgi:hypothetical protein
MTHPWAVEERARCVTELAALNQGASILFDDGSGLEPRDITEDHIVRLEKWVQVLDAVIEENQQKQHRLPDQDHVDQGDRGETTDHKL